MKLTFVHPLQSMHTEVLYISYDGMTDPLGQSQVIPYLAGLSELGYRFHLLSFEKPARFAAHGRGIEAQLAQHNITWHPIPYTKNPPVVSALYDLWRMQRTAARLIQTHPIALVHCRSYLAGLTGFRLHKRTGIPFLFDMRGFWADERVDGKIWNLANPVYHMVYRYFKRVEQKLIAHADAVVSLTRQGKAIIDSWQLRKPGQRPIDVIPCCADLGLFARGKVNPATREKVSAALALPHGAKVLSYLGAIGTWYLLDDMLRFFGMLVRKHPQWIFLFITHEPAASITSRLHDSGIPPGSVRIIQASRNEVPAALSFSDASIFFIKPVFSKQASSPTKQGEIMGMGIPVICNSGIGDTDAVITQFGSGVLLDLDKPETWEQLTGHMEQVTAIDPAKIRAGAESFYALDAGVQKYRGIYQAIARI